MHSFHKFIITSPGEIWNAEIAKHGVQRLDEEGRSDQPGHGAGQADDDEPHWGQGGGRAEL